jgi:hypothetical protein
MCSENIFVCFASSSEGGRRGKSFLEDLRSDLYNKLKARRFISYLIVEIENIWLAEKRKSFNPSKG